MQRHFNVSSPSRRRDKKHMESPRQTLASNTMYFNNFIQLNKVILLFIITVNVFLFSANKYIFKVNNNDNTLNS